MKNNTPPNLRGDLILLIFIFTIYYSSFSQAKRLIASVSASL